MKKRRAQSDEQRCVLRARQRETDSERRCLSRIGKSEKSFALSVRNANQKPTLVARDGSRIMHGVHAMSAVCVALQKLYTIH